MQFNWRAISGPALTTATALLAFLVDRHVVPVPNPAPLFVCIVALAASVSGSGRTVTLSAAGDPASYHWDLGDGETADGATVCPASRP